MVPSMSNRTALSPDFVNHIVVSLPAWAWLRVLAKIKPRKTVTEPNIFSGRTLIVGFDGWSDSADAASGAARFMALASGADLVGLVDPEDFYDFLFSRPQVTLDEDGQRQITWPGAELYAPSSDAAADSSLERLYFLIGSEPSRRWKSFVAEILELITDQDIQAVIFLGSIPADSPHTRPISVVAHSQNELVRSQTGAERSGYQGPVGIQSVLAIELERLGIPTMALWASIPHYVQNGPSPKAMLALVNEVERYVKVTFDHSDLATEAFAWERNIDELAENDEEMASYIEQLEKSRDESDSDAASGDALAMEFERFLASQTDADRDATTDGEEDQSPKG